MDYYRLGISIRVAMEDSQAIIRLFRGNIVLILECTNYYLYIF
jgi:hypothetical protein